MFKPEEAVFPRFQRIGGDINGFVSMDEFGIYWSMPKVFQREALDAVRDIIMENRRRWTDGMLRREKQIILRELANNYSDPKTYAAIFVRRKIFGEGAPGTHRPEDVEKAFRSVELEDLRREAEKLAPSSAVMGVVGDVNPDLFHMLEEWRGVPAGTRSLSPRPESGIHYEERDYEESFIAIGWPSPPRGRPESKILDLLASSLTAFPTSRLYRRLRLEMGLVYYVVAANVSFVDSGYFTIYTATAPDKTDLVIDAILDELHKVLDEGLEESEVRDMKNMFFGALYSITDTKDMLAGVIAHGELFFGDPLRVYGSVARTIQRLEPDDVRRVAREYLKPKDAVICVVGRRRPKTP